tara:strand:+ start:29016 stop:29186 length:171 start_codon:yes stop_codon:yes gene_type:complete
MMKNSQTRKQNLMMDFKISENIFYGASLKGHKHSPTPPHVPFKMHRSDQENSKMEF